MSCSSLLAGHAHLLGSQFFNSSPATAKQDEPAAETASPETTSDTVAVSEHQAPENTPETLNDAVVAGKGEAEAITEAETAESVVKPSETTTIIDTVSEAAAVSQTVISESVNAPESLVEAKSETVSEPLDTEVVAKAEPVEPAVSVASKAPSAQNL